MTPFKKKRFLIWLRSYFMPHHDLIDLPSAESIGLSPSHLVPEIIGPLGLFFIKMYYFTVFEHFVTSFSVIFDPIDPFFIDRRSF